MGLINWGWLLHPMQDLCGHSDRKITSSPWSSQENVYTD
jgi:hypothetical protein